jgi:hypothetical protein
VDWNTFAQVRLCEAAVDASVACRCGARDWRLTRSTSARSFVGWWLGIRWLSQIALACQECGTMLHISRRRYARFVRKLDMAVTV